MYKNNSWYSNEIMVCSPLQLSCNFTGKHNEVGYYSYINRYVLWRSRELLIENSYYLPIAFVPLFHLITSKHPSPICSLPHEYLRFSLLNQILVSSLLQPLSLWCCLTQNLSIQTGTKSMICLRSGLLLFLVRLNSPI